MNKQSIIKEVNKAWPKDLIIRYLYVKLAPTFKRDVNFFLVPYDEQAKIYKNDAFRRDGINMVCKTICEYYKKLFESFGIESRIITTNNKKEAHFGLIVHGDTCLFFIDPLKDLMLNQVGFKTSYFGVIPLSRTQNNALIYPEIKVLNSEYLEEMDKYLNLLACGIYINDFFDMLHECIFHHPNTRVLEFLNGEDIDMIKLRQAIYPTNIANDNIIKAKIALMNQCVINIGHCHGLLERDQFYDMAIAYIFSRIERRKINVGINQDRKLYLAHLTDTTPDLYIESKSNGIYKLERKKKDNKNTFLI